MQTFEVGIKQLGKGKKVEKWLTLEDRIYEILGTAAGECPEMDYAPDACYVLMLVMDESETEYLISTEDYIPHRIQRGERDDILGEEFDQALGYDDFKIGTKFYLTEFRDRLILKQLIREDSIGNLYIMSP